MKAANHTGKVVFTLGLEVKVKPIPFYREAGKKKHA